MCVCLCVYVHTWEERRGVKFRFRTGQVLGRCNSLCGASVCTGWVLILYYLPSPSPRLSAPTELLHLIQASAHMTLHLEYTLTTGNTQCCETAPLCRVPKIWISGPPCHVSVGHFLIWVLCIQSERYESSWISALPVVLIHQFLILCFDLRRLPLVLACLESPSHHKRPGPPVSSRSLYEQEKRFHGSNCSQRLW